jgi:cellulose synthase/poly-beta-1,6-N-acetylglucosamine synthase-like glycosyltransferase
MEWIILIFYSLFLLFIFLFSLGQLHLTWHYLKARKSGHKAAIETRTEWPLVTIQLPLYNEIYVAKRLIDSVCALEYPADKLEIQVLDDSTDDTVALVKERIDHYVKKGVTIKHLQRKDRKGFKAGALAFGLEQAKGEFIAIFDADFMPDQDFLKKTVIHFEDETGVVQTRWGHLNKDYSLLTRLQAFGLDAHFSIEQTGRSHAGSFINFNGTAGVWRKQCIIDAGGWSADTLTEDLDLSYRAQLKGWKFKFLEDYVSPAELPVIMPAIKSQQYRWNKGAAETARKNLSKVFQSSLSLTGKMHALFHLLNSSVFICLLLAALLSVPALYIKAENPALAPFFHLGIIFLIGFFSIAFFYWISVKHISRENRPGLLFIKTFPLFLLVSMGLSLHNGVAVMEGLLGIKSPFIRTPKFNILQKLDRWEGNVYVFPKLTWTTVAEGVLALYFLGALVAGIILNDYGLFIFHGMLALGFAMVFLYSLKPVRHAGK